MSLFQNRINQKIELPTGRVLSYDRYGVEGGKSLLYCHGGASSKRDIAFANDLLAAENIDLIAIDRPGIGLSTRMPGRTLLDWSQDVKHLLEQLRIEKPLPAIGWSLGGPYAMACAYALPDYIDKLALSGSCGPVSELGPVKNLDLILDRILFTCPEKLTWTISIMLSVYAKLPIEFLHKDMLSQLKSNADREIVKAFTKDECKVYLDNALANGGWGVIDDYMAIKKPWGFEPNELKVPTYIFHGSEDTLCPISQAYYLKKHIENSQLHIIEDQGHFLLHRSLKAFTKALQLSE